MSIIQTQIVEDMEAEISNIITDAEEQQQYDEMLKDIDAMGTGLTDWEVDFVSNLLDN